MSDSIKGYKDYINEFETNETNKQLELAIENELKNLKVNFERNTTKNIIINRKNI